MSGTTEKKERIISVLNACNLQKYEHDTSHPIFLSIIGEPHKFTDRLSRVIDIDQLVQLIERTIQLTNSLLQDLKSDHHNSKYEKQDRLKYQMVDCFYKKLRASNKHFTHLEWVSDHMGRQQKYTYHVTNWEVERTLGYIFILFGALNSDGKNIIIDEMAQLLNDDQISFLDINKPIERFVYFPEEDGSWDKVKMYVKKKANIELEGMFRSTIHKSSTPHEPATIVNDVKNKTRYVNIRYTLPYVCLSENDRVKSVMLYEKDWPEGAIILKK